ncbi:MAG: hypothetical protein WAV40_02155 [Microgenomates group bacterium]
MVYVSMETGLIKSKRGFKPLADCLLGGDIDIFPSAVGKSVTEGGRIVFYSADDLIEYEKAVESMRRAIRCLVRE